MRILITGGTGLIGRRLCKELLAQGHVLTVLSRRPEQVSALCGTTVTPMLSLDEYQRDTQFDVVINLAGEPIVDQRWTPQRQQILRQSRITLTEALVNKMREARYRPLTLLSGSAIGVYGNAGDTCLDEQSAAGGDFGAQLCTDWEAAAMTAASMGVRVCILRTGLVLDHDGGMLKKMHLPFRLGLGARIGNGKQWMSWIHMQDYVALLIFLMEQTRVAGSFNMVSPNPVTNQEFTQTLARTLHRPAVFFAPAGLLKLVMGERADLLTGSQRVLPVRAQGLGFQFAFQNLGEAIRDLWRS